MPSAINTRWLTAGHGPRRPRHPLTVAQTAERIAASIRAHAQQGIVRQVEEYTDRADTLVAVRALLQGER